MNSRNFAGSLLKEKSLLAWATATKLVNRTLSAFYLVLFQTNRQYLDKQCIASSTTV
jgi:hypothetical protein